MLERLYKEKVRLNVEFFLLCDVYLMKRIAAVVQVDNTNTLLITGLLIRCKKKKKGGFHSFISL